jgi:hypothetical protein
VDRPGVLGEEIPHAPGQRTLAGADEQMRVVREQRPRIDGGGAPIREARQRRDEVLAVRVLLEDDAALQPPHHDGVEGVRRIETRLARQDGEVGHLNHKADKRETGQNLEEILLEVCCVTYCLY